MENGPPENHQKTPKTRNDIGRWLFIFGYASEGKCDQNF